MQKQAEEEKQECGGADPAERIRKGNFEKARHNLAMAAEALYMELLQDGGVDKFFSIVKATKNLNELPILYLHAIIATYLTNRLN